MIVFITKYDCTSSETKSVEVSIYRQSMLESAQKGYAYEVLELEIAIEEEVNTHNKI